MLLGTSRNHFFVELAARSWYHEHRIGSCELLLKSLDRISGVADHDDYAIGIRVLRRKSLSLFAFRRVSSFYYIYMTMCASRSSVGDVDS